jgi:exodeoxyribonuclease VII large subunit
MSYSVTEILQKARAIIETNDEIGGYIQIKGEVGTFKVYGKHAYLSLKEENALLKCVYFMVPKEISTTINEGSIVEAYGYLSIYEIRGELQFYIKSMREISKAGLLMLEYERIKTQLISEKVIPKSPEEKKSLPKFPGTIAVITSRNGAAIQDVIKTIERRYPECLIQIFHTGVQGHVEEEIVTSINNANRSKADVLLLVRGGGSFEDLWCFNHPSVVRTVRNSSKPIIVGVGHETDHTLCEYAADYIGSTPTSAAMIATPDMESIIISQKSELEKISLLIKRKKAERESELKQIMKLVYRLDPAKVISDGLSNINTQLDRISKVIHNKMNDKTNQLILLKKSLLQPTTSLKFKKMETELIVNLEKIRSNDPKRYLKKGYSRIEKDGFVVNSVVQLKTGDSVQIFLKDGKALSEIQELTKNR